MEPANAIKRAIRAIEDQERLKTLATTIEKSGVNEIYETLGTPVRNVLHGSILGHPLHPLLSDVPIGAWTTAFALDLVETISRRRELGPGADAAIAFGLLGGTVTAITGWADWKYTSGRTQRTGLAHGLLNLAAASLYLTSLALRRSGARGAGQLVSTLGFGVLISGAYLGGELVFDRLIGTNHSRQDAGTSTFTAIAALDELTENEPKHFDIDGVNIVLVRSDGDVYALADACAHLGVSLSGGTAHDGCITCPAHGSTFKLENGAVVSGPSAYPQPRLDVRMQDGYIEVRRPS